MFETLDNGAKGFFGALRDLFAGKDATPAVIPPLLSGDKAATYQVQPFHGNFGKADENAKWSFSAADGRALLDKGGWSLYKQCHLVCDTTDGTTPEKQAAYTYPVAKLVDGKPTYFLRAAQTVYAGLRGGARGANLPDAINQKVLATVKRVYKAFGRDTEQMATKAGGFITKDGRVIFIGGPGGGGGGSGVTANGSDNRDTGMGDAINHARRELTGISSAVANNSGNYEQLQQARRDLTKISSTLAALNYTAAKPFEQGVDEIRRFIFNLQPDADLHGASKQVEAMLDALRQSMFDYTGKSISSSAAYAFKALDGTDWWMQWTTNGFRDREDEIFTTKALQEFVDRHSAEPVKGEFWYRHIPGTKFGTVQWQAMVGRFLVQAGPFDNTPVGAAFKEFFQQYPDGHPVVAPEGWGTSHGYQYQAADRGDGVYEWVDIKESTVLPLRVASNPWSPHPRIVKRGVKMNETERKELERIGGTQLVELVLREGEARTKELERVGVGFKGLKDAMAMTMALMDAVEDEAIKEALGEIYAAMEADDEGEMEEMAAAPEPEGEELDMAAAAAEAVPPPVEAALPPEIAGAVMEKALSREEVADALAAVTQTLRSELSASSKALTASVTAALQPLIEAIGQLQQRDSVKIAQKAADTPAASLQAMVRSVLDQPATAVKAGDPLLAQKPQEAPVPTPIEGGLPTFLAGMLGGTTPKR